MRTLTLNVLGRRVHIDSDDDRTNALLEAAYGSLRCDAGAADLEYRVYHVPQGGFALERQGQSLGVAHDEGTLLAVFDADLVIESQRLRPDLYVVHAAVLASGDAAIMLVAKSGGGKSTLSWALLHHGFDYVSDELAPIVLDSLEIVPYPRALMVKRLPPDAYPMTPQAMRTSRGFHVPADLLPGKVRSRRVPLAAIYFLHHVADARPSARRISAAEGAVRLYANTLNPLAHPNEGLDGALRITLARPCFELITADLVETCAVVTGQLDRLA